MFVRIKSTPNSPRRSIQIVETLRNGDKVSQKILRHVGIALDTDEEKKLKDLAHEIMAKLIVERENSNSQFSLFNNTKDEYLSLIKNKAGRPKRKEIKDILPPNQVTLDMIVEQSRIVDGVH